jgi:hypothetical protein
MDSQTQSAGEEAAYGTAGYMQSPGAAGAPQKGPKDPSQGILVVAIIILVVIVVAVYAFYNSGPGGGGGVDPPNPCTSLKMPGLAPGVACSRGAAGRYAVLSATSPLASGLVVPGATPSSTYTASADACVDESACQAYCSGDRTCSSYTYDMSKVPTKACTSAVDCGDPLAFSCRAWCPGGDGDTCLAGKCSQTGGACSGICSQSSCPVAGSVCTTYSGALPSEIRLDSSMSYTTAGIPATLLPLAGESFTAHGGCL